MQSEKKLQGNNLTKTSSSMNWENKLSISFQVLECLKIVKKNFMKSSMELLYNWRIVLRKTINFKKNWLMLRIALIFQNRTVSLWRDSWKKLAKKMMSYLFNCRLRERNHKNWGILLKMRRRNQHNWGSLSMD